MWWPWKPRKKYDVVEYWNNRENPNSKNPNERNTQLHIDYVNSNIDEQDKILDFGPGVGRILPAYYRKNKITGYDISSKYKERLLKAAENEKIDLELVIETKKITKFVFSDGSFDCCVSISVLLHQPPEQIANVMCELARIGRKVIIISWYDPTKSYDRIGDERDETKFSFNHNYQEICKGNNLKIISWDYNDKAKQAYFLYEKM